MSKCEQYRWVGRRRLPERYGQRCWLLKAHRGKFLLQFEDGFCVVTVRGTFRRVEVAKRGLCDC